MDTRRDGRGDAPAEWDEGGATVLVLDARPARRARVAGALAELAVECVDDPGALCARARGCVAAVALEEPGGAPPVLEAVRALQRRGCGVVCYGDGADGWAVGVQCRPLLAGAAQLLDSAGRGFAAALAARVGELHRALGRRREEERRVPRLMRAVGMEGASPPLLAAFRWALRAAALSDVPALLLGETGTGKELLARALHQLDPKRRNGPFVAVNCAAISPGVAESELFGHRRGAFTGAQHERRGLVRAAHGGVLFLDEVGELDEALQGKLLRVLQQGRVLAVGEDREVPVDVRVVAATNRDLDEMVRRRSFRADLFHRLNVLAARLPSLRERPEDVEPLVLHFVEKHGGAAAPRGASAPFVDALRQVALPGNVRQLENLVRRILAARDGDDRPLDLADLPPEILRALAEPAPAPDSDAGPPDPPRDAGGPPPPPGAAMDPGSVLAAHGWSLARSLEYCEALLMQAALSASDGNQSRAARLLGITSRSVYNKVRKHRLGG
ncbi:MAG TPA: sigma 54-interacting transcriptional regulator [Longimicrobium sp.]|nr:sigma 54-interacting transcriptional regulator [Longimicrobium sp.]